MKVDCTHLGFKFAIDTTRARRLILHASGANAAAGSGVIEVKRGWGPDGSDPSTSFPTTQTIDIDGSDITAIDVTDTAWVHIVVTTAESGLFVDVEYETTGSVDGEYLTTRADLSVLGSKGLAPTSRFERAFVVGSGTESNSAVAEVKRLVDPGGPAVSFATAETLTIDGSTVNEIDTEDTPYIGVYCTTAQSDQIAQLHWYFRGEARTVRSDKSARFSVSATTGTIDASAWYTVPFNREDYAQDWASNSSGEITLQPGLYQITADVTVDHLSGNNRTQFEHRAQLNTTGSWGVSATIDGTLRKSYSRNSTAGAQSVSMTFIVDIDEATAFRIQSKRDTGVSDGEWIADGSSATILKL